MKPLFVLLIAFILALLSMKLFRPEWQPVIAANIAMSLMLGFTAMGHLLYVKGMAMMLPPFLPWKRWLVYATGLLEILFGILLLFEHLRYATGIALIIFFMALLPVNIYAAFRRVDYERGTYEGKGLSYLWFRVPLQVFFIAWVWWFSVCAMGGRI